MIARPSFTDRFFFADDGLKLHVRDYGIRTGEAVPIVCLPGLARTAADFDWLARALSEGRGCAPRRVIALDYRGRGASEWDPNPDHYDMRVESSDILTVLSATEVERAVVIGTSRGGLHAMLLAASRPSVLHAVVLNDIGPQIETQGLARIRGYLEKLPNPASWRDAVDMYKRIAGQQFPALSETDWQTFAELIFEEKEGRLVQRYDPKLARTLKNFDVEQKLPTLWPQFEALAGIPILAIRGELSDILSAETLAEMTTRHNQCQTYIVPGQGHAPLLFDAPSIARIAAFVAEVDS
jgi:pimeloyl-ACP methyl ester carboxylesterase